MIRVLLADDNTVSLEYFSTLIDWEHYGFQVVSTAVDGEEALYEFHRLRPEVVITDIKMPTMTGIELAERIHETSPQTVVLFLSSYSEFTYRCV